MTQAKPEQQLPLNQLDITHPHLGARDDGSPSGVTITDELLLKLADMKTDGNTLPPPSLTVRSGFCVAPKWRL